MSTWMSAYARYAELDAAWRDQLDTSEVDMSPKQAHVLMVLGKQDGLPVGEVARAIGCAPTGFTPMMDALEQAGYIRRVDHESDRRAVRVHLTEKGRELVSTLRAIEKEVDAAYTISAG